MRITPSRVGDILKSSFGRLGISKRLNEHTILKVWDDVVGGEIARRAQPRRLIKRKLYVTVSSSPWMAELMHLKENVRGRINERLGHNAVDDIVFRLGQVKGGKKVEQKGEVGRDLSPGEKRVIEETVAVIEDRGLNTLLARVMGKARACDSEREDSND
ncbi:MAG: DUF721 domain-containing protein [Thermodesulfobacteriota bacterium]